MGSNLKDETNFNFCKMYSCSEFDRKFCSMKKVERPQVIGIIVGSGVLPDLDLLNCTMQFTQ